jgi:hypothetical protein
MLEYRLLTLLLLLGRGPLYPLPLLGKLLGMHDYHDKETAVEVEALESTTQSTQPLLLQCSRNPVVSPCSQMMEVMLLTVGL